MVFAACAKEKDLPSIRHCGESAVRRQTVVEGQRLDRAGQCDDAVRQRLPKSLPRASTLTYTSNGSGAGVSEFLAGQTDFGGSDSPLAGDEYDKAKQRCGSDAWNLPVVFGPLAITYNLQAVDRLVLDAATLAKIFNGKITRWDDPAIKALNSEEMPSEPIQVVYRSDGSGTTDNFQLYLDAASGGAWGKGTGKAFNGGIGQGAPGNEGTSAMVKNTEGAITYNEYSFAQQQRLFAARIVTSAGPDPVAINKDTVGKAIAGATIAGQGNNLVLNISSLLQTHPDRRLPDHAGELRTGVLEIR